MRSSRGIATTAVCVLSFAGAELHTALRPGQTPTFKSGVELVMIDATVIDDKGQPITGLGADGFEVLVDGKRRRVVSAQFVDLSARTTRSESADPTGVSISYSTNDADMSSLDVPPERFIMLAVDHSSFAAGGGRQTLEAARRFLSRLDTSDRVGLASYPDPGTFVLPTTDRAAIAGALKRVVGSGERIEPTNIDLSIGLSEASDIDGGDRLTFDRVARRECAQGRSVADIDQCRANIESDARLMVAELRMRGARSLQGLLNLLDSLKSINGRKTLVLISAGLIASDERSNLDFMGELRAASEAAAAANTVIHALHVDTAMLDAFGADRRRISQAASRDASLMATGLELLVGLNGGGLFRVVAGAESAFARITREIAAYYVLGIEPEASDRDGKAHTIKVRVPGPNVTVRSRQQFTLPRATAAAAPMSPEQTLSAAVASGQTYRDLPVRVSTQTLRDVKGDNLRVLVRADIGHDATGPADFRVGVAFFDRAGQLVGSAMHVRRLVPTRGTDASWEYLEQTTCRPGPYTLRFAVMDGEGRIGSVTHRFVAKLESGVRVRLSDLLVIDSERSGEGLIASIVDGRIRSPRLGAVVEVYPEQMSSVSRVSFAVGGSADSPAMLTVPAVLTPRPQEQRVQASAEFDLRLLPPGDYVVSATALDGTTALGRVSRPITLVWSAGASSDVSSAGGAPRLRFASGDGGRIARRFVRTDVLRPDALTYFLARLRATDTQAASPPVAAAADATARGEFDAALAALKNTETAGLSATFLKGLALYAKGELEPAAFQFRSALQISNSFLPAAFYLGACYAAGGRDEEAAGAWQTSLITESDARIIFDVLADAWLRLKDGPQAMAILTEARERWPDDDVFLPRLAAAHVLLKQPGPAMDTLEMYVGRHAGDTDVIFLALRLLYDAHAAGGAIRGTSEDAELAARLATLYRAAAGPNVALADRWAAFVRQPAR